MEILLIAFVWVLNFAISFWNAYACGKAWTEAKAHHQSGHGIWPRFMCWMGAIMSASGFTWCYLTVLALTAAHFEWLTMAEALVSLQIGYVLIIPGVLFSGLMITVDSWARAYRQGGVLNYGVAAYNTYAQIHNTMSAIDGVGKALGNIFEHFGNSKSSSRKGGKDAGGVIIILLVILAASAGIITTAVIINRVSATDRLRSRREMEEELEASKEV